MQMYYTLQTLSEYKSIQTNAKRIQKYTGINNG